MDYTESRHFALTQRIEALQTRLQEAEAALAALPPDGMVMVNKDELIKTIASKLCEYDGYPQDWFVYHDPKGIYENEARAMLTASPTVEDARW
jgi:hypothetical protein